MATERATETEFTLDTAAELAAEERGVGIQGRSPWYLAWRRAYPMLDSTRYDPVMLDLDEALDGADLVLVHEWNDPGLVARIGRHRAHVGGYALLFHDTHHRAITAREQMALYDLREYDGVLAFGSPIRDAYLNRGIIKINKHDFDGAIADYNKALELNPQHDRASKLLKEAMARKQSTDKL